MLHNSGNYATAALFFSIPLRDRFFPGVLQIHSGTSGNALLWFVMGCIFLVIAVKKSRRTPEPKI